MKEELKYQHKYNKESSDAYFILALIFSIILFLFQANVNVNVLKVMASFFLVLLLYFNLRVSYFDDIYYSYLCDERETQREKHLRAYLKIKNGNNSFKKFILSFFCLGTWNLIRHILFVGLVVFLILSIWGLVF